MKIPGNAEIKIGNIEQTIAKERLGLLEPPSRW